ncbi:predicted protein [Coccidioides posadasii str. Silveira]|uniref:Predicted protein n=1 Tax=Coccidioides posadasii (strain RMSCC 757 / Silveira) TaxID=443226 RepID=E9DF62_COCPS|nr:predicted protein [Coccidioides posadasii str. Silveira]
MSVVTKESYRGFKNGYWDPEHQLRPGRFIPEIPVLICNYTWNMRSSSTQVPAPGERSHESSSQAFIRRMSHPRSAGKDPKELRPHYRRLRSSVVWVFGYP